MTLNINEWNKILKVENVNHSPFENVFLEILNVYALKKKKFFFHNNLFLTKQLREAVMRRSRMKTLELNLKFLCESFRKN